MITAEPMRTYPAIASSLVPVDWRGPWPIAGHRTQEEVEGPKLGAQVPLALLFGPASVSRESDHFSDPSGEVGRLKHRIGRG